MTKDEMRKIIMDEANTIDRVIAAQTERCLAPWEDSELALQQMRNELLIALLESFGKDK